MPGKSDWRDKYLKSIQDAERNNPVNKDLVEACSQLADRVAALEAEKAVLLTSSPSPAAPSAAATAKAAAKSSDPAHPSSSSSNPATAQLRLDLAEALRAKNQVQSRLRTAEDELAKLQARAQVDTKRLGDLTAERNALSSKLRDRNEELVEKNKLLKDVQDENLTLNIQLDVLEQKVTKVAAENKELVDRWMKRMGHEADALNLQNESPNKNKGLR
ncbi:autophagy protein 16 [Xylariaceae sp. FL0016]|nr:autophagy protein 16 [Xylariaceae sp. FL0016]